MLDLDPSLRVDPNVAPQDRIQIMDLHSENPVVSYRNQIFTCSWYDLLGTDLVFAFPDECHDIPRLREDDGFDLISASRVKLMGQKANLISASKEKASRRPAQPQQQSSADVMLPTTNQGRFLQRLMDAKERKGETDTVRTVFPQKSVWGFEVHSPFWTGARAQAGEVDLPQQHPLLYGNEGPRGAVASDVIDPALGGYHVPPATGGSGQSFRYHTGVTGQMFQSAYPAPQGLQQRYENYGTGQLGESSNYGNGAPGEASRASYPQRHGSSEFRQSSPPLGESASNLERYYGMPREQGLDNDHDQTER